MPIREKAYKFKLCPNKEQKVLINKSVGCARFVYSKFVELLEYKAKWYGRNLVKINTFFASSQLCSNCGYKNKEVKDLKIRKWECPECKEVHDRDINASINILNEGLKIKASTG